MNYIEEAGTKLLAVNCLMCGRPLRDPESVELGVGPYCAEKHGFSVGGPVPTDMVAFERTLSTAPDLFKKYVGDRLKADGPRAALSTAIHLAGRAHETRATDAAYYIGAAIEVAQALGFHRAAQALTNAFVHGYKYDEKGNVIDRGTKPPGVVVVAVDNRWQISIPYIHNKTTWKDLNTAMKNAGGRNVPTPEGWRVEILASESAWLKQLNAMAQHIPGTLGILPSGELFVVPLELVPVPEQSKAVGGPTGATGEPPSKDLPIGMIVQLNDGREMVVGWSKGDRIGVMPLDRALDQHRRGQKLSPGASGYVFLGTHEVKTIKTVSEYDKPAEAPSEAPTAARRRPLELPVGLMPHQQEACAWLHEARSGILAMEQGLGKTAVALAVAVKPVLVVCRASLRTNWSIEAARWRPDLRCAVISSATEELSNNMDSVRNADIVIISTAGITNKAVLEYFTTRTRTLIVDEAQDVKNLRASSFGGKCKAWSSSSDRALAVHQISKNAQFRFMLTGTPIKNFTSEIWAQLHLVAPHQWPDFKAFADRYCDPQPKYSRSGRPVRTPSGEIVTDYNRKGMLKELNEAISGKFMYRKLKADVLNLPAKTRRSKALDLDEKTAREYRKAAESFQAWYGKNVDKKAQAIVKLTALRKLAAQGKVEGFVKECLDHLESGKPLVVMGHHKEPLKAVGQALEKADYRVGYIMGDTSDADRAAAVRCFQFGEPQDAPPEERVFLDVMICSITAAGVGLTLTRATEMFFLERHWTPADLVQAEDRIHRIGTTQPVTITYYDAMNTVDALMRSLLQDKIDTVAQLIDGEQLSEEAAIAQILGQLVTATGGEFTANPERLQAEPIWTGATGFVGGGY